MFTTVEQPSAWAREHHVRFVSELIEFVRFPGISAQPSHARDLRHSARWLASHLRGIGLEHVRLEETTGQPIVYADWLHAESGPTVLIYGHYDVQPPEPENEWRTPPFAPAVRTDRLFGRGASDDKGQMFVHVKAVESWLRSTGALPVNVRCVFEGEEEIGSASLLRFIDERADRIAADVAVISDSPMATAREPAVTYALRGALSAELEVRGPSGDLHSGAYGGAILNPLQGLSEIIAGLHDDRGAIALPDFYERVRTVSHGERAEMRKDGPSDADLLRAAGARTGWGEAGFSLYERTAIRPALTINGIAGGYQGPGAKAIIPAAATAKLNFRLVPDQDPAQVFRQLRQHVANLTPAGLRIRLEPQMMARPVIVDRDHPAFRAAARACLFGFGRRPRFLRAGGTIPVVSALTETLRIPVVLLGFALPEDRLHAPNESFSLSVFRRAVQTSIAFLAAVVSTVRPSALHMRRGVSYVV
jgi:acetylornithine deacetylase/succinyl-diaminopimelate desuccinylase-like protein